MFNKAALISRQTTTKWMQVARGPKREMSSNTVSFKDEHRSVANVLRIRHRILFVLFIPGFAFSVTLHDWQKMDNTYINTLDGSFMQVIALK